MCKGRATETILSRIKKVESDENKNGSINDLWTIEESIRFYSPLVTDAEIKGHVYHKQKFGIPMFGWEKWFINPTGVRGKFCTSNKSFYLKDQMYRDVKLVPNGSNLQKALESLIF